MSKRNIYMNYGSSRAALEDLYGELSDEGKFFVDYIAWHLMQTMKARGRAPIGEVGARELAMAVLQHCWDGEIPAGYPVLVEVAGLDTAGLDTGQRTPLLDHQSVLEVTGG